MNFIKYFTIALSCLIGFSTIAQNREIAFKEGVWNTQLENAKLENKLIFFDAYTTWCGPCKLMTKDVFTKDSVADLFNQSFINVKVDMEKGEGISLKDKYKISAYPTYLFINGDGEVIHKIVGSMSPNEFINEANNALNPENTVYWLAKNFEASEHSKTSAVAYLEALDNAYEHGKMSVVSKIYFDGLEKSTLLEDQNWKLALKYLNNPSSSAFAYLFANKEKLVEKYEEQEVKNYFKWTFFSSISRIKKAYTKKNKLEVVKDNSTAIRALLAQPNDYSKLVLSKLDLYEFSGTSQWDEFSAKVDEVCADNNFSKNPGDKNYIVIEASNDVATAEQIKYYEKALKWSDIIELNSPDLFTRIQLAELRKRILLRQGKTIEAEAMLQEEKILRKEAADNRQMTPPMMKN